MQKSPEQLEREKREIIASRLVALQLDGKFKDDLIAEVIFIQFQKINLHIIYFNNIK